MNRITRAPSMIALALASFFAGPALAQTPAGTAFTYQGQLTDAASPATGSFDFQFQLFDAAVGGNQIGTTLDRPGVVVNAGLFTVSLDFGQSPFAGDARWLQILVRPAGGGAYTPIAPRTPLTPAPYAIVAERVVDGPYTFAGDPDTGVFHPAADTVALAAGGTQIATITALGLSATTTAATGVALRGTGPGAGLGDGVVGITGTGGRGVLAQNTSSGTALLAASAAGDHLVAGAVGVPVNPVLRITNAGSVLAEGTLAAGNVIAAGPPLAFNSFGNPANKDEATIAAANDVYVEGGLEVDGAAFVDGNLRLGGQSATDDDTIFFDTGTDEFFRWEDADFRFALSRGLRLGTFLTLDTVFGAGVLESPVLFLLVEDGFYTVTDTDSNDFGDVEWFRNNTTAGNQIAELRATGAAADHGDLLVRGQVSTGVSSFDIAERFRAGEDVEPGDLVRADPRRRDAVLRTTGEGDGAVLGVVSADPGLLLGGTTFDVSALRAWGEDLEQQFEAEKSALEAEVLAERPALQQMLTELEARPVPPLPLPRRKERTPVEQLRGEIEQRAIELFAGRHLASVALAGRVPVKVDTSFGDIQVGDMLAPSPIPGVAMKATKPGPIVGTALESFSDGRGQVLMFVHRGYYAPPEGPEKDARIAALEQRIAVLENALATALAGTAVGGRAPAGRSDP